MLLCYILFIVTEDEIIHGIFDIPSPKDSCLCYTRTLNNLQNCLSDNRASKFMDVLHDISPISVDFEAQKLLQNLKHHKLPRVLKTSANFHSYTIPWVSGGVSEQIPEHRKYLNQLCEQVFVDTRDLIDRDLKARNSLKIPLHAEVLHHTSLCLSKCDSYCDRRDGVMKRLQHYIQNQASHPLVLHGKSGSGKTSVMAKAAESMHDWSSMALENFIILRFLGTSPQSTSIREVLISICDQICSLYYLTSPIFDEMDTVGVIQYFRNDLLVSLKKYPSKSLVIILDSIDQLSPTDGAHSMKWLPLLTPPSVHIIVSMLSEKYDCLHNIQSILPHTEESYIQLGPMHIEAGLEIMDLWLFKSDRTVTDKQREVILNAFISCPQPLFLKLIFGHARTWKSFTCVDSIVISNSIQDALVLFYESLEEQFGKVLVRKALGYFTAAKNGLTEAELEDVLSLDDEVLNDVYQYWDPPVKGVVRIPSLLWKRIRHFISDYIVEQKADGMTILAWYHRQFSESATARYVEDGYSKVPLHVIISEYFEGIWGNGKVKGIKLEHRNLDINDADRQVPSQPLKFGQSVYNYRKLSELPYHLLYSNQLDKLKNLALCNYNWIHTKLKATDFAALIRDYIITMKINKDETDVSLICEALSLSSSNLKNNPDLLAGQLLGRLLIHSSSSISKLLSDSKEWIKESSGCIFQPLNSCLISPGGELKSTITGHPQLVLSISNSPSHPLLVSYSKGSDCDLFQVWNLTSLECIENTSTLKLYGRGSLQTLNYVLTQENLVAINAQSYALWNINTGDCIEHIEQLDNSMALTCVAATDDSQYIFIGTDNGHLFCSTKHSSPKNCTEINFDKAVKFIYVMPDSKVSVVLSGENNFAVIDNRSRAILSSTTFNHENFSILHAATSCDGQLYLAAGTVDGKLCLFDIPGLSFTVSKGHSKVVKCITHISSLNVVVTGSLDKLVYVWNIKEKSVIHRLEGHQDGVWCLDSLPSTAKVVSGSKDDYLKVWDVISGKCLHTLEGHSSWVSCVKAIASDIIVSGSNDKNLKFWRLASDKKSYDSSNRHLTQPECIALSSSGQAASGGPDAVKIWDPLNGKCLCSLPTSASCLTFTNDGKHLITGSKRGTIEVYDTVIFSQTNFTDEHKGQISSLLLLDLESDILISTSLDSTLRVWNSNYEASVLSGHTAGVTCVSSSRQKGTIASGSQNGCICVWNLVLYECIGTLKGHSKTVNCIAYNANDTRLISGSDDTTTRVWNISDMSCTLIINHLDSVKALCVTDVSTFIAGVHCSCKQLISWNIETGESFNDFIGHTHAIMCMLRIDRHHILTGSRDGTVRIWNCTTAEMLATFDLQSQVKHISLFKMPPRHFLLAATTKSGPIAFLEFNICK